MRGLVEEEEARATWGEEGCDVCCCRWVGVDMLQVPFAAMLALELKRGYWAWRFPCLYGTRGFKFRDSSRFAGAI